MSKVETWPDPLKHYKQTSVLKIVGSEKELTLKSSVLNSRSHNLYRYVHKERDEETGLYYYGARYHAGWLCRFISVDPLKDKFPFYSTYQYAGNKPITFIDLDGLEEGCPPNNPMGYSWSTGSDEMSTSIGPVGYSTSLTDQSGAGGPYTPPTSSSDSGLYGDGPIVPRAVWIKQGGGVNPFLAGMLNGGAETVEAGIDLATFLPKYTSDSEFRSEVNAVVDYIYNNPEAVIEQMGKDLDEWTARMGDSQSLTYSGREEAYTAGVFFFDILSTILSMGAGAYLKSMKAGSTGAKSAGNAFNLAKVSDKAEDISTARKLSNGELFELQIKNLWRKKIIKENEKLFDKNGVELGEIDFETADALVEVGLSLDDKMGQLHLLANEAFKRQKKLIVVYDHTITPTRRLTDFKSSLGKKWGSRVSFVPSLFNQN